MALVYKNSTREIVVKMKDGVDKDGKDKFKNLTFDNVSPDAKDESIIEFLDGIKSVSSGEFVGVKLVEPKTIVEQA